MRTIFRNILPVVGGRGVVQISGYVDTFIASLLPTGAVAALSYRADVYMLPISVFGMSVAAAELPQMASEHGSEEEIICALRRRLDRGIRQMAFFVIPTAVAFMLIGRVLVAALLAARQVHAETRCRLVHPLRLGDRPAGLDAGPPLLVRVLRIARHEDAGAHRAWCASSSAPRWR